MRFFNEPVHATRDDPPIRRASLGDFVDRLVEVPALPDERRLDVLDPVDADDGRGGLDVGVGLGLGGEIPRVGTSSTNSWTRAPSKPVNHSTTSWISARVRPFLPNFPISWGQIEATVMTPMQSSCSRVVVSGDSSVRVQAAVHAMELSTLQPRRHIFCDRSHREFDLPRTDPPATRATRY